MNQREKFAEIRILDGSPKCGDCVFAAGLSGRMDVLECRKRPPRLRANPDDYDVTAVWPRVRKSQWCGEFTPYPDDDESNTAEDGAK